MSPFETATAAHLAGTIVLALFFVLLERHDPRPYLRDWMACWIAQAIALGVLLFTIRRDWQLGFGLYLFLETLHGALLWLAAHGYRRTIPPRRRMWVLVATLAWAAVGPVVLAGPTLFAGQLVVLAFASFAAAFVLWPRQETAMMGVRVTAWMLVLLAVVYLGDAAGITWAVRSETEPPSFLDLGPFNVLLLQMLLAFGMVLAASEDARNALFETNAQLADAQRRLKTLAETDPLTGCFNRRVFRELVDDVRGKGTEARGVVVMLDMDGLKAINDQEGHGVGDGAIRAVADAIRSRTRNTDVAVRWGGDEFVVVMPGISLEEGRGRRDQIIDGVAQTGFSVSAGIADYSAGVDIMTAVDQADRDMYASRQRKRR
jgi:diguanylate cyclase (GGDEF)-like protein